MSIKVMSVVWELDLPLREKMLLLALADWASDDGSRIFPSVATMVRKTGIPERSIQRLLGTFRDAGVLIPVRFPQGGRGHTTEYRLDVERVSQWHPFNEDTEKGCQDGTDPGVKGARADSKGCQSLAPDPSEEPSEEDPSVRAHARSKDYSTSEPSGGSVAAPAANAAVGGGGGSGGAAFPKGGGGDRLVAAWNRLVCDEGGLDRRVLDAKPSKRRKALIQSAWRYSANPDVWAEIFRKVPRSKFLRGETGNEGWVGRGAGFDWCINPDNAERILEGNYDDKEGMTQVEKRGHYAAMPTMAEALAENERLRAEREAKWGRKGVTDGEGGGAASGGIQRD